MATPLLPDNGEESMIEYLISSFAYALSVGILSLSPLLVRGPSATSEESVRAVIYARVSTDLQSETSVDQQVRECQAYCVMQGWDVVNIYRDEGYSGTNVERPSFQLLMDEKETWDVVVAAKMDRFHRNFRNLGDWADTLRGWGKDFAVLDIQIDTTTPVGMLIFRIMGAFAAMEAELIRSRTISGLKGKKNSGKHTGRPPYGYSSKFARTQSKEDRGLLEPCAEEVPTLLRIFELRRSGMTPREIAETLNTSGIATRQEGKIWTKATIHGILMNREMYQGYFYDQEGNRLQYEWEPLLEE
jgi:site-specific DNA recombinase